MDKPCGSVVKNHDFQSGGPGSIPHGILCLKILFFSLSLSYFFDGYSFVMALHYYFLPFEVAFK